MIKIIDYKSEELKAVLRRSQLNYDDLNAKVAAIVADVRERGDSALFEYTERFDGVKLSADTVRVTDKEIDDAYLSVDEDLLGALRRAKENIVAYQSRMFDIIASGQGVKDGTGYMLRPMDRAGIYVPGGKAAYPSTVMMAALTAKCAHVGEVVMTTPAGRGINPLTLVAARECGVDKIYKVGGAQAVAAMAYGTQSVEKCSIVTGPGNIFVALAKKAVYGDVGIDSIAGPSEILIIADSSARADFIAADLLSQAEHDELASCFLVTPDASLAAAVQSEVERRLRLLPKVDIATQSIENHSAIILVKNLEQAAQICNDIAPEHMELSIAEPDLLLPLIRNAGAVFMGHFSPEPVGDYFAGPNHVLPTSSAARFSSALSVDAFVKKISLINYTKQKLAESAKDIIILAETEGLTAHAEAIRVRAKENV